MSDVSAAPNPCCVPSKQRAALLDISRKGSAERRRASTGSTEGMIRLDGGTFLMGTDTDEGFPADGEGPVRKVALDGSYSNARVAGRWVAWQRAGRAGKWRIVVHDLRSGKERLVIGHVAAHSLKLTTRGSIAWAQEQDGSPATPLYANEVEDGGRLLDSGEVDAASVDLAGRRLSWLSAGEHRSAILR